MGTSRRKEGNGALPAGGTPSSSAKVILLLRSYRHEPSIYFGSLNVVSGAFANDATVRVFQSERGRLDSMTVKRSCLMCCVPHYLHSWRESGLETKPAGEIQPEVD